MKEGDGGGMGNPGGGCVNCEFQFPVTSVVLSYYRSQNLLH